MRRFDLLDSALSLSSLMSTFHHSADRSRLYGCKDLPSREFPLCSASYGECVYVNSLGGSLLRGYEEKITEIGLSDLPSIHE